MVEEAKKPKRKYTRRQQPMVAASAVMLRIKRGKRVETVYCDSFDIESGVLRAYSSDGPAPFIQRIRFIYLSGAEVEACQRFVPQPIVRQAPIAHGGPQGGPQIEVNPVLSRVNGVAPAPAQTLRSNFTAQGPVSEIINPETGTVARVPAGFFDPDTM